MATQFDEKKQDERLEELHRREEEQLAEMLAHKYGIECVDLTNKSTDTDALRLIPEEEARSAEIAAFRKIHHKLFVAMRAPERPDSLQALEKLSRLGYEVDALHRLRASTRTHIGSLS